MSNILNQEQRLEVLKLLSKKMGHPKPELNFTNNFELLCAVMLSAQTTDAGVNKVTKELFLKAPTPQKMVDLGEDNIGVIIKSVGLWKNKSKNLVETSKILIEKYDSQVPNDYKSLVSLPGVGSKTAKVVLNVGFNLPTIAVDTHIFRVLNRTGFCVGKTVKEVETNIIDLVDDEYKLDSHHYFLLHGRYTCTAKNPKCSTCVIEHLCKKNAIIKNN